MVTFGSLMAARPSKQADGTTRLPSARLRGLALARNNGRVAREALLTVESSNPYRKGTKRFIAFVDGWRWADRLLSAPDEGEGQ